MFIFFSMCVCLSVSVRVYGCVCAFRYKADQAFLVGQDKSPVGAYLDVEVRRDMGHRNWDELGQLAGGRGGGWGGPFR